MLPMQVDRTLRFSTLFDVEKLIQTPVRIIGCGAVGRQVALQLAAMGVSELYICDFDTITSHNVGSQGWHPREVGKLKIEMLRETLQHWNGTIWTQEGKWEEGDEEGDFPTFLCVDSLSARRKCLRKLRTLGVPIIIDGRMGAEYFQVFTVPRGQEADFLDKIPKQSEQHQAPCTARSTLYCANIVAGYMVASYTAWIRKAPSFPLIEGNILSRELLRYRKWEDIEL